MPRSRKGLHEYGVAEVTLNGSGAGTAAVTFGEDFVDAPSVWAQPVRSGSETATAGSVTSTGFTLTIASSGVTSATIEVAWFAHEKR